MSGLRLTTQSIPRKAQSNSRLYGYKHDIINHIVSLEYADRKASPFSGVREGRPQNRLDPHDPQIDFELDAMLPTTAVQKQTTDSDIRRALRSTLQARYEGSDALVVDELPIALGYVKLDVAVITGRLDGYEIKSDRDRLDRLERQVKHYAAICDRLTIVTTGRHEAAATARLPAWCGIVIASSDGAVMHLETRRAPEPNPDWDVVSLLFLLWQNETYELARSYGMKVPRDMAKGLVHASLARRIAHEHLRADTLDRLRARRNSAATTPLQ